MQHEVLLACLGHPGNVIKSDQKYGYCVDKAINFLSEAEIEATNRIVKIGYLFSKLQIFVEFTSAPYGRGRTNLDGDLTLDKGTEALADSGLYLRALGLGLKRELCSYRETVCKLEQSLLGNLHLPLSYLHQGLREYHMIFPALVDFCEKVQSQNLKGAQISEALYKQTAAGFPTLKSVFERLLCTCHHVLFNQMSSWMMHGVLIDPYSEFFVQPTLFGGRGHHKGGGSINTDAPSAGWNAEFAVRVGCLPSSYIPLRLATKTLFIGKAVRVLRLTAGKPFEKKRNRWLPEGMFKGETALASQSTQLRNSEIRATLQTEANNVVFSEHELKDFSSMWESLKSEQAFHLASLENIVERMHDLAAERLWRLIVVQADLPKYLNLIKTFFLLAKGDFFSSFIEESRMLMRKPPSSRSSTDLNLGPFQQCARACGIPEEDLQKIRIHLEAPQFEIKDFSAAQTDTTIVGDACVLMESGRVQLCGSTVPVQQHAVASWGESKKHGAGGIWYNHRKEVHHGFKTSFSFCYSEEAIQELADDGSQGGITLCLQNFRCDALGRAGYGLGAAGIPNSFSVRLSFLKNAGQKLSVWSASRTVGYTEEEETCHSIWELNKFLEPEQVLTVAIHYHHTREVSECLLQVLVNPNDEETSMAITLPLHLNTALQLDPAGAYVGITASAPFTFFLQHWEFSPEDLRQPSSMMQMSLIDKSLETQKLWLGLQLEYNVDWPLQLILTQEALQQYNRVFAFLFYVKRVQFELEHQWPILMHSKQRKSRSPGLEDLTAQKLLKKSQNVKVNYDFGVLWLLRSRMAFFVQNLQYYLQVDVIEAQYSKLLESLRNAKDFNSIYKAHQQYLQTIRTKCYLDMSTVKRSFHRMLQLCLGFCTLITTDDQVSFSNSLSKAQSLLQEFSEESNLLFIMLESADAKELSMRLNFNGFYSATTAFLHMQTKRKT